MHRLTLFATRRPWSILVAASLLTAFALAALPGLRIDTDGAAIRGEEAPVAARSKVDADVFGSSEDVIVLVLARPAGPSLHSAEGLATVRDLHRAIAALAGVRLSGVRSIASLEELELGATSLKVRPILDALEGREATFEEVLERARGRSLTEGLFLSPSGAAAAIYVPLLPVSDRRAVVRSIQLAAEPFGRDRFEVALTGPVVAQTLLGAAVLEDLATLIPVMTGVLALCLLFFLGSVRRMVFPLAEVGLVLAWTFGAMALAGVPITLVTTSLPIVLMVTAITDEVHLLEHLDRRLSLLTEPIGGARDEVSRAVVATYRELEKPILTTWLTTAVGLASLTLSPLPALSDFGLWSAIGILLALLVSFLVVPALMKVLPPAWLQGRRRPRARRPTVPFEKRLLGWGRLPLLALLVAVVALLPGLWRLRVEDNWIRNFPQDSPLVAAENRLNRELWGSHRFDLVLSGESDLFYTPRGAAIVAEVVRVARDGEGVGGVASYLDPLRDLASDLGEARRLEELPRERFEDLLTLAQSTPDLGAMSERLAAGGRSTRVQVFLKGEDFRRDSRLAAYLTGEIGRIASQEGLAFHTSGDVPVGLEMVASIVEGQLRSIGWSVLLILGLAALVYASPWALVVVLLPTLVAAFVVFAVMGLLGTPLGVATSMFGSLAIGTGVDFSLHLVDASWAGLAAGRSRLQAGLEALERSSRALRWNAVLLVAGFSVLLLSRVLPNRGLGLTLVLAIASTYLTTLLVFCGLAGERTSLRPPLPSTRDDGGTDAVREDPRLLADRDVAGGL